MWRKVGIIPPTGLVEARLLAHHAAQWVTRGARSLLLAAADDSHSNLGWDDDLGALLSHPLPAGGRLRLGLAVEDLTLLVVVGDRVTERLPLDGRDDAEAGAWVAARLLDHGLDAAYLGAPLPYEIPYHPVSEGAAYEAAGVSGALGALARWYGNAAQVLEEIRADHGGIHPGSSPVRCWPHHFDIATLIVFDDGDAEVARSIGVGLSPGDEFYAEPYFYANPWPAPAVEGLPALPAPGGWHSDGFVGAVATGSDVVAQPDQAQAVRTFLNRAIAAGREALGV